MTAPGALPRRLAKLRRTAFSHIVKVFQALDTGEMGRTVFSYSLRNRPDLALRCAKDAERHLREAKRALKAWAKAAS